MKHYIRLDGLRGIAALVVVWFHLFEGFATSSIDQRCNHGYLAVDFFFLLSGFVLSYAYDGRLRSISAAQRLSFGSFLRRRIIRLHPMLLLGLVWGAVAFVLQGSVQWDGTAVSSICVIIALLTSLVLIPAWPGCPTEVRGNGEMFPLNGPMWSLFFEYVASILYGVVLHRLSTKVLYLLALLFAGGLSAFALCNLSETYHIGVGWTLAGMNFPGGLLRVLFSFTHGNVLATHHAHRGSRPALPPLCSPAGWFIDTPLPWHGSQYLERHLRPAVRARCLSDDYSWGRAG